MTTKSSGWIDTHVHAVPPAYRTALKKADLGPRIRIPEWSPEMAISMMDRAGIDGSVVSLSVPGAHLGDDQAARSLARSVNTEFAEIGALHPRLGAFATLTLPDVEGSCREAEYALDVLKLDGIGLLASYGKLYLGDPALDPLMDVLDARGAAVLVHPNNHPSTQAVHLTVPNFLVEFVFDTTRAAVNLVLSGVTDRYPNIRFILSHAGGTLPFVSWRIAEIVERQLQVKPFTDHYSIPLLEKAAVPLTREDIFARFKRFYYDTALSANAAPLSSLSQIADPSRILFGSDWPYCSEEMVADMQAGLRALPQAFVTDPQAVKSDNARRMFPRFQ